MKYALLLAVAVACIGAASAATTYPDPIAAETAWDAAIVHRDSAALSAVLAEHFVGLNENGTFETKAETLHDFQTGKVRPLRNYVKNRQVHMTGDSAVITGTYVEEGRVSATDAGHYRLVVRYADTYTRINGSWLAIEGFGKTVSATLIK